MPAVLSSSQYDVVMGLERREWRNTVGQSGMTPTAFAFLVPVFVVVFFAPFLCVFCVRRRSRNTPVPLAPRKVKKPALRRAEARERLKEFTAVADVSEIHDDQHIRVNEQDGVTSREENTIPATTATTTTSANTNIEPSTPIADSASISERECAICLSTLYGPSPPAPALLPATTLSPSPEIDPAATHPPPASSTDPEPILKLRSCSHAFHTECLVSWFVLRKTTCPICRTPYISTEDMKAYEEAEAAEMEQMSVADEEAAQGGQRVVPGQQAPNVSNWRYFWAGQSVLGRESGNRAVVRDEAERTGGGNDERRWWQFWKRRGGGAGGLVR